MTSEDKFGVVKQPIGLCNTIDKCIRSIYIGDKSESLELLEKLKGEAIDLRTWGEQWKDKFLKIMIATEAKLIVTELKNINVSDYIEGTLLNKIDSPSFIQIGKTSKSLLRAEHYMKSAWIPVELSLIEPITNKLLATHDQIIGKIVNCPFIELVGETRYVNNFDVSIISKIINNGGKCFIEMEEDTTLTDHKVKIRNGKIFIRLR